LRTKNGNSEHDLGLCFWHLFMLFLALIYPRKYFGQEDRCVGFKGTKHSISGIRFLDFSLLLSFQYTPPPSPLSLDPISPTPFFHLHQPCKTPPNSFLSFHFYFPFIYSSTPTSRPSLLLHFIPTCNVFQSTGKNWVTLLRAPHDQHRSSCFFSPKAKAHVREPHAAAATSAVCLSSVNTSGQWTARPHYQRSWPSPLCFLAVTERPSSVLVSSPISSSCPRVTPARQQAAAAHEASREFVRLRPSKIVNSSRLSRAQQSQQLGPRF